MLIAISVLLPGLVWGLLAFIFVFWCFARLYLCVSCASVPVSQCPRSQKWPSELLELKIQRRHVFSRNLEEQPLLLTPESSLQPDGFPFHLDAQCFSCCRNSNSGFQEQLNGRGKGRGPMLLFPQPIQRFERLV